MIPRSPHSNAYEKNDDWRNHMSSSDGSMPSDDFNRWTPGSDHHFTDYLTSTKSTNRLGSASAPTSAAEGSHSHPLSEVQSPTPIPTSSSNVPPSVTSTTTPNWPDGNHGPNRTAMYAGAAISCMIFLAAVGLILFIFMRRRKRQQQILAQTGSREMKMHNNHSYVAPPGFSDPLVIQPHYAAPPSTEPPPHQSPLTPQPVILGPIPAAGSSGTYLTGMDTSDRVSLHDHTGLANPYSSPDHAGLVNPFADDASTNDEPPPPYRPRSVPSVSRDSSLRVPPASHSRTHLIEEQGVRSPFADPHDDDAVSIVSGRMLRRNRDDLSVVSDISYQHDPVVPHPRV